MDTIREVELKQAAQLLEDAKEEQRQALNAERIRLDELAAKREAEKAAKIVNDKKKVEAIEQHWNDVHAAEQKRVEALVREQREADRQLELQRIAQQAKEQEARDHEANVKRIRDEAFAIQQRTEAIRQSAQREEEAKEEHVVGLADIPVLGKLRFPAVIEQDSLVVAKAKVSAEQERENERIAEIQAGQAKKAEYDKEQASLEAYSQQYPYIMEP